MFWNLFTMLMVTKRSKLRESCIYMWKFNYFCHKQGHLWLIDIFYIYFSNQLIYFHWILLLIDLTCTFFFRISVQFGNRQWYFKLNVTNLTKCFTRLSSLSKCTLKVLSLEFSLLICVYLLCEFLWCKSRLSIPTCPWNEI